jgi:hypothetical protein
MLIGAVLGIGLALGANAAPRAPPPDPGVAVQLRFEGTFVCPSKADLLRELKIALGEAGVTEGGPAPMQGVPSVRIVGGVQEVRLQFQTASGEPAGTRTLEIPSSECVDVSSTAALAIRSWLTGIGWEPKAPATSPTARAPVNVPIPAPSKPPKPASRQQPRKEEPAEAEAEAEPVSVPPSVDSNPTTATPSPPGLPFTLRALMGAVFPSAWTGTAVEAQLEFAWAVTGRFSLATNGSLRSLTAQSAAPGRIELWGGALALILRYAWPVGPASRIEAGVGARVEGLKSSAVGFTESRASTLWLPALHLDARGVYPLTERIDLIASFALSIRTRTERFSVVNVEPALTLPPVSEHVSLGVGWRF